MHGQRLDNAVERVEGVVARVLRGIARTIADLVGGSPSTAALSDDDLQPIRREWEKAVADDILPALVEAYAESARTIAGEFAHAGRPVEPMSLEAPETADFLDAATNRLVGVSDTLWEVARKELADGIRAGEGVEELAARLQEAGGFGIARARMIARTEVVGAANASSLAQALRLGDQSMRKQWLATMDEGGAACDERTRAAHCTAHEQVQPLGEPFQIGDTWLMYPGQPIGAADEVIQCRCTQGYLLEDNTVDDTLTAAAEIHTGAMVALRPSLEDAKRLAVDGGEPADQLHTTLMYLGAAADISEEAQARIIEAMWQVAEGMPPLTVEGFAVSAFNPGDSNDRDPCIVLGLSGDGLDDVHGHVGEALSNLESEPAGFTLPEQHAPWQPHITLIYTDDVSMVEQLADRVGPVTFDAIRVAFAGQVFDIPLGEPEPEPDDDGEEGGDFDWSSYFEAAIQAQFQSRMPPQLQAHWIRRLRLGTKGSFDKCVRELREYFPEDTEGLCANLYKTATGRWPSQKKDTAAAPDEVAFVDAAVEVEPVGAPDADTLAVQPGEHFHTWVMEGVSTGLRQFAPGAITWREPPFAYHWQWKSSAHSGLPETVQTGLVTRVVRDGNTVHFFGKLDLRSPEGLDYARRVAEGWARWSSVGVDESVKNANIDVEYVLSDGEPSPDEEPEVDLMTFRDYRVAEVTGVSVPALADALVEPTPELFDTLTQMGVLEPAAAGEPEPVPDAFDAAGEAMPEMTMPADVEATAGVTVDLNDDGTVTVAGITITTEQAGTLAETVEELLALTDGPTDRQVPDFGTVSRTETGEIRLEPRDGEPVTMSAADAEALAVVLRSLIEAEVEEVEVEDIVTASAGPVRHIVRSVTVDLAPTAATQVVIASTGAGTHTITIPNVPPAEWFSEPPADLPQGAFTVTDEGRVYGWLAPAGIAHRAFRNRRVEVPMGNVDYSRWMGSEALVAGGGRVVAGPITFECGHCDPSGPTASAKRMEHYDNSCSIAAKAAIGENEHGVWIAGALEPGVSAEQVSRMLGCRLSGDWAPHPEKSGWREFVAALLVPVPGFPMGRSAPSTLRVADGALVAAAVPIRLEVTESEVVEPVSDAPMPDLQPAMDFVARTLGRDPASRMAALRDRIHRTN
jgi:2'-5' RNA ligase